MQLIPDNHQYGQIIDAGRNNLEVFDLDIAEPERVVVGYTPDGGGSYIPDVNTVFLGGDVSIGGKETKKAVVTFEHENIHYEQFRRILGDVDETFYSRVDRAEDEALDAALEVFDDKNLVSAVTMEEHLTFYNLKRMTGLISGHEGYLESVERIKEDYQVREDAIREHGNHGTAAGAMASGEASFDSQEEALEMHYTELVARFDQAADEYWDEITRMDSVEFMHPLIERHDLDVRDDLLEAQTQFWSMFRFGLLDDLPRNECLYPEVLENEIDRIDSFYSGHRFYDHGKNVMPATVDLIEEYRHRLHTTSEMEEDIVSDMMQRELGRLN